MGERLFDGLMAILTAIIGVAIIAVIVSNKSATGNVLKTGGQAFAGIIGAALTPTNSLGNINLGGITIPPPVSN
jgi:hypothetical protein